MTGSPPPWTHPRAAISTASVEIRRPSGTPTAAINFSQRRIASHPITPSSAMFLLGLSLLALLALLDRTNRQKNVDPPPSPSDECPTSIRTKEEEDWKAGGRVARKQRSARAHARLGRGTARRQVDTTHLHRTLPREGREAGVAGANKACGDVVVVVVAGRARGKE
ncbi:hypothetical protein B0H16DRAFT_1731649 [Mycena metata]|uniref:Uncharacterized protein n=1 Tax=Mycena metata TaxID=1033252 RepID=A0AAD7I4F7_9AGAR|nr:hypothetical protein B0H16DRAFT_1731649 [Mycena metata]